MNYKIYKIVTERTPENAGEKMEVLNLLNSLHCCSSELFTLLFSFSKLFQLSDISDLEQVFDSSWDERKKKKRRKKQQRAESNWCSAPFFRGLISPLRYWQFWVWTFTACIFIFSFCWSPAPNEIFQNTFLPSYRTSKSPRNQPASQLEEISKEKARRWWWLPLHHKSFIICRSTQERFAGTRGKQEVIM